MTKGHKFSIGFMIIGCLLLTQLAAWATRSASRRRGWINELEAWC
jgi:hypothetical protein